MRHALAATAAVILSALAACTPAPAPSAMAAEDGVPAEVMDVEEELLATVEDVDMESRILTLRRTDGVIEKIYVPPEVENLTQVRLRDQIFVTYVASLQASRVAVNGAPVAVVDDAVATAPAGARPGIATSSTVTTVVTVEDYDPETHIVSFTGPSGILRMAQLRRSEMQNLASTLKKGDQVEVTYSEAAALTIRRPEA